MEKEESHNLTLVQIKRIWELFSIQVHEGLVAITLVHRVTEKRLGKTSFKLRRRDLVFDLSKELQ